MENKKRILIVDDEPYNQVAVENILEIIGLQDSNLVIKKAINGEDALNVVQNELNTFGMCSIDLIFMDLNMPIMDGCESTRQIRTLLHNFDQEQPLIIGTSGQTEQKYVEEAIKSGMN